MNESKKPASPPLHEVRRVSETAPAPRGDSGVLPAGQPEGGFSAMLQHAGLWDLVQLRCESRVRCVVCVTSDRTTPALRGGAPLRQVGYLYFNEGQIVHAATGGIQGERAVLEILGWTSGTWDSCERPWPTIPTITTSWQGLFLRAAQQQDEAKRNASADGTAPARRSGASPASEPVPVRKSQPQPALAPVRLASAPVQPRSAPVAVALPAAPPPAGRREESGVSYRPEDFEHSVRMNARGAIVTGHGAVETYAELAAYCCRLGDLLGDLLGMGKLQGIDASLRGSGRCFVVREAGGDTVMLRPRPDVDPNEIRMQLNLT